MFIRNQVIKIKNDLIHRVKIYCCNRTAKDGKFYSISRFYTEAAEEKLKKEKGGMYDKKNDAVVD